MNTGTITKTAVFEVSLEKVWKALTEKEEMKTWYFEVFDFELKPGNCFYFYEPGGNQQYLHRCEILHIEPLKKFEHTWTFSEKTKGSSVLSWELTALGQATQVSLIHRGLETFEDGGVDFAIGNFEAGWEEILNVTLKAYLEN